MSAALVVTNVRARQQVVALTRQLEQKCAKLYDARTPEKRRRELSLEVSILRSRLLGVRDPLAAMVAGSCSKEEC